MNRREALNVAWHARVNGLDRITPENLLGAFAVLEQLSEQMGRVEALAAKWRNGTDPDSPHPRDWRKQAEETLECCADELEQSLKGEP